MFPDIAVLWHHLGKHLGMLGCDQASCWFIYDSFDAKRPAADLCLGVLFVRRIWPVQVDIARSCCAASRWRGQAWAGLGHVSVVMWHAMWVPKIQERTEQVIDPCCLKLCFAVPNTCLGQLFLQVLPLQVRLTSLD